MPKSRIPAKLKSALRRNLKRKIKRRSRSKPRPVGSLVPKNLIQQNYATISEVGNMGVFNANTAYAQTFNIDDFPRAKEMSKLFMFYRPKIVVYKYIPQYNTFQDGNAGTAPQILMIMNRCGNNDAYTFNDFCKMGALPKGFIKPVKLTYKPNLLKSLQIVQQPPGSGNIYNQGITPHYGWVQTYTGQRVLNRDTASDTLLTYNNPTFYGHDVFIYQENAGSEVDVCNTTKWVVWEFKHPRWPRASGGDDIPATTVV